MQAAHPIAGRIRGRRDGVRGRTIALRPRRDRSRVAGLLLAGLAAAVLGPTHAADAPACSAFAAGGPACGTEPIGSGAGGSADRFVGNPIDVVTGNKYQHREDYRAFGSRLAFSRHYNTAQVDVDRGLGRGWRHDYDVSLARTGETGIRVFQSDGRQIDFEAVGVDAALAAGIDAAELSTGAVAHLPTDPGDGYLLHGAGTTWRTADGRALAFRGPFLASVAWPDGDRLSLGYERGRLASVTDRHGRAIRLEYTPGRQGLDSWEPRADVALAGHLERVVLPGGDALEYRYDGRRNLTRVDHRGAPIERLTYDDRDLPNHLMGLEAEGESKRWHYDGDGRGDGYADGHGSVLMLEYLPGPIDSAGVRTGRTIVRRRDGAWLDYRWTVDAAARGGIDAVIEHGCATCVGVPRPATRVRASVDGTTGTHPDGAPIPGLTVESLGADVAVVSTDDLSTPVTVRFDRRARPARVDLPEGSGDGDAVREAVRLLDGVGTVDGSGIAYASRRKASCPPPLFRTCEELEHDRQMAILSGCVYEAKPPCGDTDIGEWEAVPYDQLGRPPLTEADFVQQDRRGNDAGFYARPYKNQRTGEIVVAFRGTENDWRDIVADAGQLNGRSDQYRRASLLADKLETGGVPTITYTGHSLGGGLATTAAATTQQQSITFNSAALTPETAEWLSIDYTDAERAALNYVVPGEAVTVMQDIPYRQDWSTEQDGNDRRPPTHESMPAPGQRYTMRPPPPRAYGSYVSAPGWMTSIPVVGNGVGWLEHAGNLHRMAFVLPSMEETIEQQCGAATS